MSHEFSIYVYKTRILAANSGFFQQQKVFLSRILANVGQILEDSVDLLTEIDARKQP